MTIFYYSEFSLSAYKRNKRKMEVAEKMDTEHNQTKKRRLSGDNVSTFLKEVGNFTKNKPYIPNYFFSPPPNPPQNMTMVSNSIKLYMYSHEHSVMNKRN